MRHLATALLTPALGLFAAAVPAGTTATAALAVEELPTKAAVKDFHDDVSKDRAPVKKRSGDLDVYKASGAQVDDGVRLVLKVDDLRKKHTKAEQTGPGSYVNTTMLRATLWLGKQRWVVSHNNIPDGSGNPAENADLWVEGDDEATCTTITQKADYADDTVTFVVPLECLPGDRSVGRVSGSTSWINAKDAWLSDRTSPEAGSVLEAKSPKFRFR